MVKVVTKSKCLERLGQILFCIWIVVTIISVRYAVFMYQFYNEIASYELDFHILGGHFYALFILAFLQISMLGVIIIVSCIFSRSSFVLFIVWFLDIFIAFSLLSVGLYVQINMTYILEVNLKDAIQLSNKEIDAFLLLSVIQFTFECCGATKYDDWFINSSGDKNLPWSCCKKSIYCSSNSTDIYREGCALYMNNKMVLDYGPVVWLSIPIIILKILFIVVCIMWVRSDNENEEIEQQPNQINAQPNPEIKS